MAASPVWALWASIPVRRPWEVLLDEMEDEGQPPADAEAAFLAEPLEQQRLYANISAQECDVVRRNMLAPCLVPTMN